MLSGWDVRAAPNAQTKPNRICGTRDEEPAWCAGGWAVRGSELAAGSAFVPFASFPSKDSGLWKVFCIKESLPYLFREGQIAQIRVGLCSCPLLLNSVFLSVFHCCFLPHLLLLYVVCQYWVFFR